MITSNVLATNPATVDQIKAGTNGNRPLCSTQTPNIAFYGLAKAANDSTQSASNNEIGTYTDTAKQKIQNMLGITDLLSTEESSTAVAAHTVNSLFTMNGKLHRATNAITIGDAVEVGTNCEVVKADEVFVKNTDIASSSALGISKINSSYGINISTYGELTIQSAGNYSIKTGQNSFNPIVPEKQHMSVFYGLAAAAGDSTQSASDNAVGTYTDNAKSAIRTMIGAGTPLDVQINGSSIVSSGVADISVVTSPINGSSSLITGGGVASALTMVFSTTDAQIKAGTTSNRAIAPINQHTSVFYALAKAAGDTTQSSSDNAVGTYTESAKTAIRGMLGIDGSAALVENVSGTTPSITGQPNVRYICGEVSTLSVTPPSCGSVEVIFSSGSTATTLTVPNTVKWPAWFNATTLETDVIYDIIITDATYGAVMTWAS